MIFISKGVCGIWGVVQQKLKEDAWREVACVRCKSLLSYIFLSSPMPLPSFSTSCPCLKIKSKREKKREEEKKKDSSSLHGDLVQIPSDLCERVHAAICFFKIWKKRSRFMDEERDLQGASMLVISVLWSSSSMWIPAEVGCVCG